MDESLYCKLFVDSSLDIDELAGLLSKLVKGSVDSFHKIRTELLTLDCMVSHSRDELLSRVSEDGFIFYKFYLDIEPVIGVPRDEYISQIGSLIGLLRARDIKAVPACDFEDELRELSG